MNIAERFETTSEKRLAALSLPIFILAATFFLLIASTIAEVHFLTDPRTLPPKQVGFIAAPNWFVVFLFLYPLFVVSFCLLAAHCRSTVLEFLSSGAITGADGRTVSETEFKLFWKSILKAISAMMLVLLAVVVAQAVSEWRRLSYLPIIRENLGTAPLDWSSYSALYPKAVDPAVNYVFSALAYGYMASALFVFLSVFVYGAAYCWMFYHLSLRDGQFRLVFRDDDFPARFSKVLIFMHACTVLGLLAALMMRLQHVYLNSDLPIVTDLIFVHDLFPKAVAFGDKLAFTSFGIVIYSLILYSISFVLLYEAFRRAREYTLEKVTREDWRNSQGFAWDSHFVQRVREATFFRTVVPWFVPQMAVIMALVVGVVMIGYGTLPVALLVVAGIYASVQKWRIKKQPDPIPPPPSPEIIDLLAVQLANQAADLNDPNYLRSLVMNADLPQEYKDQQHGGWTGDPAEDAKSLVRWANEQGINPLDPKFTTLGSILWPELGRLGPDKAAVIVAIMVSTSLIRDKTKAAELRHRYQVPEILRKRTPVKTSHGPDFDVDAKTDLELQSFFSPEPNFLDVGFLARAIQRAASVCLVDAGPSGTGTGVVIDYDLILTNYHVLVPSQAVDLAAVVRKTRVRFGVLSGSNNPTVDLRLAENPVVASSPIHKLDYVLLRLERPAEVIAREPVPFTTTPPTLRSGLNLLHHPEGLEMKLSLSSNGVYLADSATGRLQYVTKAANGSSGSPCFNEDWQLVGIHHAERSRAFGSIREGILISNIYNEIRDKLSSVPL